MSKKDNEVIKLHHKQIDLELYNKFQDANKKKTSINDFISEFIFQFLSKQTQKAYLQDLNNFFAFLAKGGVQVLTPSDIKGPHFQLYRDELIEKKYSSATINRKLVAVRSFMKWSLASKLIDHNPLDIIKLPKVRTESPTVAFTDKEVLEMIKTPDLKTKKSCSDKICMILLFSLGLRRSELVQIKLQDIQEDRNHFVLTIKGKGDKERILPLSNTLMKEIKDYIYRLKSFDIELKSDDFLLQSAKKGKNNKSMDGSTVYRIIEKYAKLCGINKKVSPHSCRATAISHLLDTQNTPIRDVAIFAGHSKITTTERYDKRRNNLDKSAAYQINYNDESA